MQEKYRGEERVEKLKILIEMLLQAELAVDEIKMAADVWNIQFCDPQFNEEEVVATLERLSKTYHTSQIEAIANNNGFSHGFFMFGQNGGKEKVELDPSQFVMPDKNKEGKLRNTLNNLSYLLAHHADIAGLFQYNLFSDTLEMARTPAWTDESRPLPIKWNDCDRDQFRVYLATQHGLETKREDIHSAIMDTAKRNRYHPILDYLESLRWDGVKRIDKWLTVYGGAEYDLYTQAVGKNLLIAACARVHRPGCKFDDLIILEGAQGVGKSQCLEILGGEWYGSISLTDRDKDTISNMMGKWIIEVPEMVCFGKKELDSLKAFISNRKDTARLSYDRYSSDFYRRSVFVGTFNPSHIGYLKDDTGNRRFYPVKVKTFDIDRLKEDRDQLFAEAWKAYKDGEAWWISDPDILRMAKLEQDEREPYDDWQDKVKNWIIINPADQYVLIDVYEGALKGDPKNYDIYKEGRRLGKIMKNLGYEYKKIRDGQKLIKRWVMGEDETGDEVGDDSRPF